MVRCNLSGDLLKTPIYTSPSDISLTSLCDLIKLKTKVYYNRKIGHLQTEVFSDLDDYYDKQYQMLIDSEDEDQLYTISEGEIIYRYQYQADTLLNKMDLPKNANLLDFGCAKASTIKYLIQDKSDIQPYLFDVSEMYVPYWEKFIKPSHYRTYSIGSDWSCKFDIVTSFFSLEHVAEPIHMLKTIWNCLKENGLFYCLVPNALENPADIIVIDHINHFTNPSIEYLLIKTGFNLIEIDDKIHDKALVITARKTLTVLEPVRTQLELDAVESKITDIIKFWSQIRDKINTFERQNISIKKVAIYGSGIYGTFISSCLRHQEKITCYVDRSPFRQGKQLLGRPIIPTEKLDRDVEIVYVGLNPASANDAINQIDCWKNRDIKYFYL